MVVISKYISNQLTAGPKAKVDVEKILKEQFKADIKTFKYTDKEENSKIKRIILKVKKLLFTIKNIKKDEIILIQFPFSNEMFLTKKAKNKIALIHDLDGLRREDEKLNKREIAFLNTCKYIVAHNDKMKQYLIKQGIEESKIHVLELFDYLCDEDKKNIERSKTSLKEIAYAGNLISNKSPFLYQLNPDKMNFSLALYGKGIEKDINEKMKYKGAFQPEKLPNCIQADLGLVWDGNYDESDEEKSFKKYTKYNNPHKLSCYIAAGIPVIVWEKAAIADLVKKEDIGYTINSIYDINNINFEDYKLKKANVEKLMKRVRTGFYTCKIIKNILEKENSKQ